MQQFFQLFVFFRWLKFLKLNGYTAVQQNFYRETEAPAVTGGGIKAKAKAYNTCNAPQAATATSWYTIMATRMGPYTCRGAAGTDGVSVGFGRGLCYSTTRADYIDEII